MLGLLCALATYFAFTQKNWIIFGLKDIVVYGRCRSTPEEVLAATGIKADQSIFLCDIKDIRSRVMKLTWVADATVRRSICGELYVHITEREPIAVYNDGAKFFLVDKTGVLIDTKIDPCFRNLPVLYGKNAENAAVEMLKKLQSYKSVRSNISAMSFIWERRWDLRLNNGILVKLPAENVDIALKMLTKFIDHGQTSSGDILTIDLRSSGRAFLQLSPAGKAYYNKRSKAV